MILRCKVAVTYLKPAQAPSRRDLSMFLVLEAVKVLESCIAVWRHVVDEQQEQRSQCKRLVEIGKGSEVWAGGIYMDRDYPEYCEDNWRPEDADDLSLLVGDLEPAKVRDDESEAQKDSNRRTNPTDDCDQVFKCQ